MEAFCIDVQCNTWFSSLNRVIINLQKVMLSLSY